MGVVCSQNKCWMVYNPIVEILRIFIFTQDSVKHRVMCVEPPLFEHMEMKKASGVVSVYPAVPQHTNCRWGNKCTCAGTNTLTYTLVCDMLVLACHAKQNCLEHEPNGSVCVCVSAVLFATSNAAMQQYLDCCLPRRLINHYRLPSAIALCGAAKDAATQHLQWQRMPHWFVYPNKWIWLVTKFYSNFWHWYSIAWRQAKTLPAKSRNLRRPVERLCGATNHSLLCQLQIVNVMQRTGASGRTRPVPGALYVFD